MVCNRIYYKTFFGFSSFFWKSHIIFNDALKSRSMVPFNRTPLKLVHGIIISLMFMYLGDCSSLPNPDNGLISISGTTSGSIATYSCDNGCTRRGSQTRTCQSDGTWSGNAPTCECRWHIYNYTIFHYNVLYFLISISDWIWEKSRVLTLNFFEVL